MFDVCLLCLTLIIFWYCSLLCLLGVIMPPKRGAVRRTPPAQSEEEDMSVASFIHGVATAVHKLNGDVPPSDGSALLEKFLK